jgi:hypothetical protein
MSIVELEFPKVERLEGDDRYGKFVVEPLAAGYGTTLGNSLRRVLLSSLPGAAITAARVRGAPSPPVYYLGDVFAGVRDELYLDLCHLGPEGNRRIAARMREVLRRGPPA